jgi:hypothetical protein
MGELKPRMAASMRKIRHVFMHDWNPIGADGLPDDGYDAYVMPVYSLLRQQKGEAALTAYLAKVYNTSEASACQRSNSPSARAGSCRSTLVAMTFTIKHLTNRWSRPRAGVITSFVMTSFPQRAARRALARGSSSPSR